MIGKAYVAILTLRHPAAGTTLHHRSKPTTVLKENHLFFLFQSLFHILYQKWRELSDHPLFAMQFLDIHRNNLRQLDFFISFFQLYETIFSLSCILPWLDRGSGRTQQGFSSVHGGQYNSRATRMIAGSGILLLIRIFVLFVHNHQSQIPKRQENRRTNAQNNIISVLSQLLPPYFNPFGIGEFRMIDTQTGTENPLQTLRNLSGQCNFRQQI